MLTKIRAVHAHFIRWRIEYDMLLDRIQMFRSDGSKQVMDVSLLANHRRESAVDSQNRLSDYGGERNLRTHSLDARLDGSGDGGMKALTHSES